MFELDISKVSLRKIKVFFIFITFLIYGNAINNEYAIDDNIVVDGVEMVEEGFSGIPQIFTSHMATGQKQNFGYRPLSMSTYAIERQLFKHHLSSQTVSQKEKRDVLTQANISHLVNVIIYAFTGILLFNFLSLLFSQFNVILPFFITLLFLVHPLHTEPVSNIKGRDELLMFMGMLLSLTYFLKYTVSSKLKHVLLGVCFAGFAALSKKTGLIIIPIIPVLFYYKQVEYKKILIVIGGIVAFLVILAQARFALLTEPSIRTFQYFENPLFFTNNIQQRITTGSYTAWFYLTQLLFPKDLAFYYGFSFIPVTNWSNWQVWAGLISIVPLGIYGFIKFIKRDVVGLGIVLWLGVMLAYLNIILPVVGIVADRFTYVFSLGFSISVIYFLLSIFKVPLLASQIKTQISYKFIVIISLIIIGFSARTISRNSDWENYLILFYHDIEIVDNSAKAHSMLANYLFPIALNNYGKEEFNEQVDDIIYHYTRAIEIDSTYTTSLNNLGSAYTTFKKDYKKGINLTMKAIEIDSNFAKAYFSLAKTYELLNQVDSSYKYYLKSITTDIYMENDIQAFSNFSFENSMISSGLRDLLLYEKTEGGSESIYLNIANLYSTNTINTNESIIYFVKAFEENPKNLIVCNHIAKLYKSINDMENWNYYNTLGKSLEN